MKHRPAWLLFAGAFTLLLSGCDNGVAPLSGEPYRALPGGPSPTGRMQADQWRTWPLAHRAAYIAGRVTAADMLYRMGHAAEAAAHLKQPVEQVYAVDRAGLQALGFQADLVDAAAGAIDVGRPPDEVGPLLAGSVSNLMETLAASGEPPKDLVSFLMRVCAEAYESGADRGDVINAEAYQASYGYAVTARDLVSGLDSEIYGDLRLELDILVLMWPASGPVDGSAPPPEIRMAEQFSRVKLALVQVP